MSRNRYFLVGMKNSIDALQNSLKVPQKVTHRVAIWPLLLYTPKNKNITFTLYMNLQRSIFIITKKMQTIQRLSPEEGMNNKMQNSIHTMEHYSARERNEIQIYETMWMNLENITLSDRSQSPKTTYCRSPFIWNVQNKQIHRDRKQIIGCLGPGVEGASGGDSQKGRIFFLRGWICFMLVN